MLKKIPNILTIGRIIIVPFFVLAFYLPGFYGDLTALILFIVASFTDFLDGMLARMIGEESKLGELLDPIADKNNCCNRFNSVSHGWHYKKL
jgi:cardiolipin synthase